ncbi:MAG: DUF748 domain-containing protein, partial [Polaromonas sp.]
MKSQSQRFGKVLLTGTGAALRSPRWQRRLAWVFFAVLLLWALAYAAVPFILKWQLEKIGAEKLGRQLTVGAIDFKPWSLELTLHDLVIARARPADLAAPAASSAAAGSAAPGLVPPPSQASSLLTIKRIYIDAELQSLLRLGPVADAIRIEEPAVSLAYLGNGRYDIDDILARLQKPDLEPAGSPLQFALYNLDLSGGRLDLVDLVDQSDASLHQTHALRDLHLAVPFLSNLASKREIKTTPQLAFTLNGSRFDTAAEATPFAQTRKTDANITLRNLDLKPYLAYWPASLPWQLQSAVLNAEVKVAFEQTPATLVRISGQIAADQVRLLDTKAPAPGAAAVPGQEVLAFERLQIRMDDVRPLDQFVKLSAVELTAPTLSVTRDRAGQLNLLPRGPLVAIEKVAASASPIRAGGQNDSKLQAQAAHDAASAAAASAAAAPAAAAPWKVQ